MVAGITYIALNPGNEQQIVIKDLNIEKDEYNIYNLVGHIVPLKDFDYLEARILFYDEHNAIIGQAYAWNMLNPQKDTTIDVGNGLGGTCSGTPKYAVISFYDSVGSDKSIANFTVYFNDTSTDDQSTDSGSSDSSSSSSQSVYAYKSDGTPMYSKSEADSYMLNKYGTDDYERQSNGYIDPDSVGGEY